MYKLVYQIICPKITLNYTPINHAGSKNTSVQRLIQPTQAYLIWTIIDEMITGDYKKAFNMIDHLIPLS